MKQVNVKCTLRVFTGPMKDKLKECEFVFLPPIGDQDTVVSKRYAERLVRNYMHSLLKLTDRTGVDPELLAMAATGLQVNILLASVAVDAVA